MIIKKIMPVRIEITVCVMKYKFSNSTFGLPLQTHQPKYVLFAASLSNP